ncbi:MAG: EAL domain-containing protein, partial [Nitrospinae bacterium]|nr:EAL domain-containing protein [Nitrospinota bacterium]
MPGRALCALLLADSVARLQELSAAFSAQGEDVWETFSAQSLDEALRIAARIAVDVAVADGSGGVFDPVAAAQSLRETADRPLPLIIITADTTEVAFEGSLPEHAIIAPASQIAPSALPLMARGVIGRARVGEIVPEAELFRAFMAHSPAAAFIKDHQSRYLYVNKTWEEAVGKTLGEVAGKVNEEIWPPETARILTESDRRVAAVRKPLQFMDSLPVRGKPAFWLTHKFPIPLPDPDMPPLIGGMAVDITERREMERELERRGKLALLLHEIVMETNEARSADSAMLTCLEKICAFTGWEIGHAYTLDRRGLMVPSDLWAISDPERYGRVRQVTMAAAFNPGEGLPGRVMQSGAPAWILNINADTNFFRTDTLNDLGLRSALGFPVLERDKVVAVLEFFTRQLDPPSQALRDAINSLAIQLGRVTERKRVEEKLELAHKIIEGAVEGVMVTDPDGVIQMVNPAFTAITGFPPEEVIGRLPRLLRSGKHDPAFYQALWDALVSKGRWEGEIWNRRKNGEAYPEWLTITAIHDDKGRAVQYVGMFYDITDYKRSQQEVEYRAYHDALTGLPNRALFLDRAKHAIARAHRSGGLLAVLFLDLDNFKHINDTLGHVTGDLLLKGSAVRLVSCLREGDTVCRFGGDEFAVLLENARDEYEVATVAGRIIEHLSEPYSLRDEELITTTSVGVTLYPADGETEDELIKNADMAMYHAKEKGRHNYQFFTPRLQERFAKRLEMETGLRRAIEREELAVMYQPKVSARDGTVVGMEALARWRRGGRDVARPDEFIPLAEEIGVVSSIDEWILRASLQFVRGLDVQLKRAMPLGINLSINLSARDLERGDLVEMVTALTREAGIAPRMVELELTESAIVTNLETATSIIGRFRAEGFCVSVDDFGAGYSSLNYLRKLPVNILKIDRSFVTDLPSDQSSRSVARAIISLAHELGIKVVAEGIELETQIEILRAMG